LGQATYDSNNKSCKLYSNVHYQIIWAEMGFSDNPQNYIVEVRKSAIEEEWAYNRQSPDIKPNF